jgi:hypothetical protein
MAVGARIPMLTTMTGARAAVQAIEALRGGDWKVSALQDYFSENKVTVKSQGVTADN